MNIRIPFNIPDYLEYKGEDTKHARAQDFNDDSIFREDLDDNK